MHKVQGFEKHLICMLNEIFLTACKYLKELSVIILEKKNGCFIIGCKNVIFAAHLNGSNAVYLSQTFSCAYYFYRQKGKKKIHKEFKNLRIIYVSIK